MKNNQENKSEDLVKSEISNIMKVKVSDYKGKFRFTIPAEELRKIGAKVGDYLKVTLRQGNNKIEYYARIPSMPKSRTNLQVRRGIPKQFVEKANIKKYDEVELQISSVDNIRTSSLITDNNYLDVLAAIPEKTKSEKTIMADLIKKEDGQWCKFWYCSGHGGKAHEIELKRFIKIDKSLGEFFGLMQAESSKKGGYFNFTNKFLEEVALFCEVAKRFGITKEQWRYTLFYNPNLCDEKLEQFITHFSKKFQIIKKGILPIKNKNLLGVIYCIYIPRVLLREIMISSLIKIRDYVANLKKLDFSLEEFAKGFILKDLLGDGTVIYGKNNVLNIQISESDLQSQKDIINIFNLFGIHSLNRGIKIDISTNFNSCIWFVRNQAFKGHNKNRSKILNYALDNYYFTHLYNRLKEFKSYNVQDFSKKHSLSQKSARKYLEDNHRRGFLYKKNKSKLITYSISQKGIQFLNLFENAKIELSISPLHDGKG